MKIILLFISLTACLFLGAQIEKYPQNYFRPPMEIPLYLAGNFGELRANHFHAGIDIKTQGIEGKKIYASAEGHVSRIKIELGGYGKIIYVDHPNGYTTTYAHLKSFSSKIDSFIKKEQYQKKSFTINWYPDSGLIAVKKGEIIALSGNTGGSGGPHLHFEIRETKSEHAINVLMFGMPIKDDIAPIIKGIRIYPLGPKSLVNNKISPSYFSASKLAGEYKIHGIPLVSNKIGIGVETLDIINGSGNRCGVFKIRLKVDELIVYEHRMDKIPFEESRYLNAHTDYYFRKTERKWIHKSFIEPNNNLSIYSRAEQNGILNFTDTLIHKIEYSISDVAGNVSRLSFNVKANNNSTFTKKEIPEYFAKKMEYHLDNEFSEKGILIKIPQGSLYKDIDFNYHSAPNPRKRWSDIHYIHTDLTPLHKPAEIYIKCEFPSYIPMEKLVAVRKSSSGDLEGIEIGEYKLGYYSFKTKYFGNFYIFHDIVPPTIKSLNIYDGKNIAHQGKFDFIITDNLSGIKTYNCYIDGNWVLIEYDRKKKRLTHFKHGVISKGKHKLKLVVTDAVGNENIYSCTFFN